MKEKHVSRKIQQPDIERPDISDPFVWASISRVREEWVRQIGPQLDIDVEKCILGGILSTIIGDDSNVFNWTFEGDFFDSSLAFMAQEHLLERMDWEIKTPETPENIREELKSVLKIVSPLDWKNLDEFNKAKAEWFHFKEWVEGEMETHPKLKIATQYNLLQAEKLHPYWNEFLYGVKVES